MGLSLFHITIITERLKMQWMELENITLSEVSQAQKAKSCMISHICGI
jgi:hypothetical protein